MASGDDEILSSSSLHGEYMRPMSANMFIDSFSHTHTPSFLWHSRSLRSVSSPFVTLHSFHTLRALVLAGSKRHIINKQSFPTLHISKLKSPS
jgi:hypothetical protein